MWAHVKALALTIVVIVSVGSFAVCAPGGFLGALVAIAAVMILATVYMGCLAAVRGDFS